MYLDRITTAFVTTMIYFKLFSWHLCTGEYCTYGHTLSYIYSQHKVQASFKQAPTFHLTFIHLFFPLSKNVWKGLTSHSHCWQLTCKLSWKNPLVTPFWFVDEDHLVSTDLYPQRQNDLYLQHTEMFLSAFLGTDHKHDTKKKTDVHSQYHRLLSCPLIMIKGEVVCCERPSGKAAVMRYVKSSPKL